MTHEQSNYARRFQLRIEGIQTDVDKLLAKAQTTDTDTRIAVKIKLTTVAEMQDEAHVRLARLRLASSRGWKEFQIGAERTWQDLKLAVSNARDELH